MSLWVPDLTCDFFCMQNSVTRIRISSLYASQPSSVVLCIQRAPLGPELHISMGPSLHLWLCAIKSATLDPELLVSKGPRPHLSFCACNTA